MMNLNQIQSGANYRKISFIRAVRSDSAADPSSEQDFIILNPHKENPKGREAAASGPERFSEMEAAKQPRELFKESAIELKWKNIQRTVSEFSQRWPSSLMLSLPIKGSRTSESRQHMFYERRLAVPDSHASSGRGPPWASRSCS